MYRLKLRTEFSQVNCPGEFRFRDAIAEILQNKYLLKSSKNEFVRELTTRTNSSGAKMLSVFYSVAVVGEWLSF